MVSSALKGFAEELADIERQGLCKRERVIETPQEAWIQTDGNRVLNFCANNYLGLADHPEVVAAAREALDEWGFGMASVRFICGTQTVHKELEAELSDFLGTEDTILYSSCFDANGGLFETLLGSEDAVISDSLNHASIIDGIRLCKAKRYVYANNNMEELEARLKEAQSQRFRIIATDGVFSMDGTMANLGEMRGLADKYDALVMIDDCHAVGFMGEGGRGSHEAAGLLGKIDIITGTLGKALGGASGGYTSGRREVVNLLRQRSRPYLFSNTLAPPIAAASLAALHLIQARDDLRNTLTDNTTYFRRSLKHAGFTIADGSHPIVPIMLGEASLANKMADRLLELGVYVVGFSYPVVPKGAARIRTQVSAAHSREDLDYAVERFVQVKRELAI